MIDIGSLSDELLGRHPGLCDRSTLAAVLGALAGAGYAIVPREPTQAMLDYAADQIGDDRSGMTITEWYIHLIQAAVVHGQNDSPPQQTNSAPE